MTCALVSNVEWGLGYRGPPSHLCVRGLGSWGSSSHQRVLFSRMSRVFLPQLQENRPRSYQSSPLLMAISSESVQGDRSSLGGEEDTLAWPEIPGLWKEDYKPFQVAPQIQTQPHLPYPP